MKGTEQPRAAGAIPPTNDEGPTVAAVAPHVYKQDENLDCHRTGVAGHADMEALSRLQALATPRGLLVYQLRPSDDVPAFLVARAVASREFQDLAAVRTFLGEYEGRRYG